MYVNSPGGSVTAGKYIFYLPHVVSSLFFVQGDSFGLDLSELIMFFT